MSPTKKWNPFKDILSLHEKMGQIFDDALVKYKGVGEGGVGWMPPVDIFETEKKIYVKMELPAVDIKDIDIEIVDNNLTIRGERRFDKNLSEENYHRMECSYGPFSRSFSLQHIVDKKSVEASLKDGLLNVALKKIGEVPSRKIEVELS